MLDAQAGQLRQRRSELFAPRAHTHQVGQHPARWRPGLPCRQRHLQAPDALQALGVSQLHLVRPDAQQRAMAAPLAQPAVGQVQVALLLTRPQGLRQARAQWR